MSLLNKIIIAAIVLIILFFVWYPKFIPLQDYPDWLFQSHLFSTIFSSPLSNYELVMYPVPNSTFIILTGLIGQFVGIFIAGKIVLSLSLITYYFGCIFILSYNKRISSDLRIILASLLAFNVAVFIGNINYILSLGLLFFGIGYVLQREREKKYFFILFTLFPILLFFTHGIAFGIWLIFILLLAIKNRTDGPFLLKYILLIVPSLLLLLSYFIFNKNIVNEYQIGFNLYEHLKLKVYSFLQYFALFYNFNLKSANNFLLLVATLLNLTFASFAFLIFLSYLKNLFKKEGKAVIIFLPLILLIIFILAPEFIFGIHNPGQRFLIPAFVILVALYYQKNLIINNTKVQKLLFYSLSLLLILQITYILNKHIQSASHIEASVNKLEKLLLENNLEQNFEAIFYPEFKFNEKVEDEEKTKLTFSFFVPTVQIVIRIPYYVSILTNNELPIFATSVLMNKKLLIMKSVDEVLANKPKALIVILESQKKNYKLFKLLSNKYSIIESDSDFLLLKRKDDIWK